MIYDLPALQEATDNFSQRNKLGEGGFGAVYKVIRGQYCSIYAIEKEYSVCTTSCLKKAQVCFRGYSQMGRK